MLKFPENYDIHKDPTYLLAVKGIVNVKDEKGKVTKYKGADISQIAALLPDTAIEESARDPRARSSNIGKWNSFLANNLVDKRGNSSSDANSMYTVIEAFAKLGVLYASIVPETTRTAFGGRSSSLYHFFILPPYLALYWDDLYKPEVIGANTMAAIVMTPARYNMLEWRNNLGSFVEQDVLLSSIFGAEEGATVQSSLNGWLDTAISVTSGSDDSGLQRAYVPVFAYDLLGSSKDELPLNTFMTITRKVYDSMKQREAALPPPVYKVPGKTAKSLDKIRTKNIAKLKSTEKHWLSGSNVQHVIGLWVEPIVSSEPPLTFTDTYPSTELTNGAHEKEVSEYWRKAQECVRGNCDMYKALSENPNARNIRVAGFIDYSKPARIPGSLEDQDNYPYGYYGNYVTNVNEIDCNVPTWKDPNNVKNLASTWGVQQKTDESIADLCARVKKVIDNRISASWMNPYIG